MTNNEPVTADELEAMRKHIDETLERLEKKIIASGLDKVIRVDDDISDETVEMVNQARVEIVERLGKIDFSFLNDIPER